MAYENDESTAKDLELSGGGAPIPSKEPIKAALAKIAAKQERVNRFKRYYAGDHPMNFSSEKFTTEFARRLKTFRDNLCPLVVKAPADRLEITAFSSEIDSDAYNKAWEIWKRNQMPRLSKRVHRDAFKVGDAYAIVWADADGNASILPQDPAQCCVFYNSETGAIDFGAKLWRGVDGFVYLTLYFADRIEKYITRNKQSAGMLPTTAAAFVRRNVPDEDFPLMNDIGRPAMFHFGLEDSILTDVIPLNDALNKSIADLLVSSEANSLRQRWISGIAFEINPETGEQVIPFEKAAQYIASEDATAKFGDFNNASLKDFLEQINDFRTEIATVAGIPQYYLRLGAGAFPSGDALAKAEARFTATIADAQLDFGETWAGIMKFALEVEGFTVTDKSAIAAIWKPADAMTENQKADLMIKKKNVGVSTSRALSELGYSDDEIKKMADEKAADQATAADGFNKVFNAGPGLGK